MKNLFVSLSHTAAFLFQLSSARQALPKVDLGYEIHQALSYNVSHTDYSKKEGYLNRTFYRKLVSYINSPIFDMLSLRSATCASQRQSHRLVATQSFKLATYLTFAHRLDQPGV